MNACPVCEGELRPFLGPLEVPVFCNVLHADAGAARAAARGTMELAICERCAMVVNAAFEPELVAYGGGYENALQFSAVFREFAEAVAARLVERYDLHGARVVEAGCGDGFFLDLLCAAGGNRGVGYDPSAEPVARETAGGGGYEILEQYYGPGTASGEAQLVCARHVLEHIGAPRPFVASMREASGEAVLYLEVPDAEYMLREHAFWDVIYEHCCYFAEPSMRMLLEAESYEVLACEHGFGGQYLGVEARPSAIVSPRQPEGVAELLELAAGFEAARAAELARWDELLSGLDGRVAIWGAGSKGVTLAAQLGNGAERLAAAVDVNPRKRGLHLPVSGIEVLAPEDLTAAPPDHVLVTNRNYLAEIESALHELGIDAKMWAP